MLYAVGGNTLQCITSLKYDYIDNVRCILMRAKYGYIQWIKEMGQVISKHGIDLVLAK